MKPLILTLSLAQFTALVVMAGAMAFIHPAAATAVAPQVDQVHQTVVGGQR